MGVARTLLVASAGCQETADLCAEYRALIGHAGQGHKGTLCVFAEDEEGAESPVVPLAGMLHLGSVPPAIDCSCDDAGAEAIVNILFRNDCERRICALPSTLTVYYTEAQSHRACAVAAAARARGVIVECASLVYGHSHCEAVLRRELGAVAFGGALFASCAFTQMVDCSRWAVSTQNVAFAHGDVCADAARAVCIEGVCLPGTPPGARLISDATCALRLLVCTETGHAFITPSLGGSACATQMQVGNGIADEVRTLALNTQVESDAARLLCRSVPLRQTHLPVLIAQPQNAPLHSLYRALLAMDGLCLGSDDVRVERLGALVAVLVRDACRNEARLFPAWSDRPALRRRLVAGAINELRALPLRSDALRSLLRDRLAAFRPAADNADETAAAPVYAQFVPLVPYLEVTAAKPETRSGTLLAKRGRSSSASKDEPLAMSLHTANALISADCEARRLRGREYFSVPFGSALP